MSIRKNPRMNEVAEGEDDRRSDQERGRAYARIITRYPAMDRALDAKARLEALHQTVPRPTRAALENNKKEVASRHEDRRDVDHAGNFEKHPDVAKAAHMGEPTLVDPEPVTATGVVQKMAGSLGTGGENKVTVETTNGQPPPNQEPPRSDTPAATATADVKPSAADPNELKPNVEPEANALPPLQQSNQIDSSGGGASASASSAPAKTEEMADISSSKKKKKKGLAKLNPF